MRTIRILTVVCAALVLALGTSFGDESLKSGPQVGQKVPGPFHPLNINGPKAGEKNCLYCSNGSNPVAMIFARDVSEPLTKLIKEIDQATAKNSDSSMGSFVVFLSDDENLSKQLKELAEKENLKHTVLSIDNPAGPKNYKVSKDADVTVVLYTEHVVKANHAYRKGGLDEKGIDQVLSDVSKIVSKK